MQISFIELKSIESVYIYVESVLYPEEETR
jgi:hypothetical protein